MKIIVYLVTLAAMLLLIVFDVKNIATSTGFIWFDNSYKTLLLPMVVTVAFLGGLLVGALYNVLMTLNSKKSSSAQSRRVEKMSVDKDSADMRVQTLEAKIKTLETALDKALGDKN